VLELGLEFDHGLGGDLADKPFFEGLVEALHLAAGLRVVRAAVAKADAACMQGDF
jgi:hypothetical protein